MKRLMLGIFAVVTLVSGGYFWTRKHPTPQETGVREPTPSRISSAAVRPLARNRNATPPALASTPAAKAASFANEEGLRALQAAIQAASEYADDEKRSAVFGQSGLDTEENYRAALDALGAPYQEPVSEAQVKRKVVGLFFLELSRHLDNVHGCTALLESMDESLKGAREEKTRVAILTDAGDLAKVCLDVDEEGFRGALASMPPSPIRNQALAQVGEES